MSTSQSLAGGILDDTIGGGSRSSSTPLLPGAFPDSSKSSTLSTEVDDAASIQDNVVTSPQTGKRRFWKLGRKENDGKVNKTEEPVKMLNADASHPAHIPALRPISPLRPSDVVRTPASPQQRGHPYGIPSSPGHGLYASSPRHHSPASSQIFERNVQEDVVPPQASPHLPSHIITENYIPPALDASADTIVNDELDPDSVEIVTHATHQSASITISGGTSNTQPQSLDQSLSSSHQDTADFHHTQPRLRQHQHHDLHPDLDPSSNYATLDATDVRRLSFVSFADVVHAEQAEHLDHGSNVDLLPPLGSPDSFHQQARGDSMHGLTSSLTAPRSPSPMRSPVSSHGRSGTSPPTSSASTSLKGLETSPHRSGGGPGGMMMVPSSPLAAVGSGVVGELNVETMRQALKRTGSGDLGAGAGGRSAPMSAVDEVGGRLSPKGFK